MTHQTTWGYLVYRLNEGRMEFLGICQTDEKAKADAQVLAGLGQQWSVAAVPFIGWGQVAPGVFSQNGKPPLKIVE